jgi:hypothetical protein
MRTADRIQLVAMVALAALVGGCASNQPTDSTPPVTGETRTRSATLVVDNRSSSDMDVYVNRSGQRSRLGLAPGSRSTRFTLSPALMTGPGEFRFEAVPITGGRGSATEPVHVQAGETITLDVPPQ